MLDSAGKKRQRRFRVYSVALGKARDTSDSQIALEFKKLAERLDTWQNSPGEYAILCKLDSKISCLALD